MKGNRAVLTAVVVVLVLILGWWLFGRGGDRMRIDLIERFAEAQKRPSPELFSVVDAALAGESKRAILVQPAVGTRLIWKVRVPDDGWLWVSVGMRPDTWTKEGNGIKFLVGVSDGRAWFEELFAQHVDPYANEGDRKWIPVRVDLSTYAGEEVDIIFNTYASPSGPDDQRNDLGLWGTPEIVVR